MTSKQFLTDFYKHWVKLSDGNEFLDAQVEKFTDRVFDNLNNPNCRKVCEKFDRYLKNRLDIEDGSYDSSERPLTKLEYYGYEPDYECDIDLAERLYGVPDPRLVEDY